MLPYAYAIVHCGSRARGTQMKGGLPHPRRGSAYELRFLVNFRAHVTS